MRLGLFGGTFNPIHLAHLIVADHLREEMELDRVIFMPVALPPHKAAPAVAAVERLEMVRLAVAGNPRFEADDLEVVRGGRSYTIDTLRDLAGRRPGNDFFVIIGMDAFADIRTWKEAASVFSLANFIVIPRPGHPPTDPLACLPTGVATGVPAGETGPVARCCHLGTGRDLYLVNAPLVEISSSDIRRRIREGRSVRYLLPEEVLAYIRRQKLYRESP